MNKILIELYLPVVMKSFDIFIPAASTIGEITLLVCQLLPELTGGLFLPGPDTVLCDRTTGRMLPREMTAAEAGLEDGSQLYVM